MTSKSVAFDDRDDRDKPDFDVPSFFVTKRRVLENLLDQ
jgi:hypothetical protein